MISPHTNPPCILAWPAWAKSCCILNKVIWVRSWSLTEVFGSQRTGWSVPPELDKVFWITGVEKVSKVVQSNIFSFCVQSQNFPYRGKKCQPACIYNTPCPSLYPNLSTGMTEKAKNYSFGNKDAACGIFICLGSLFTGSWREALKSLFKSSQLVIWGFRASVSVPCQCLVDP